MKTAKEILIEKWYPILGDGTENNLDELLEENSELGKMARNLLEAMEEYADQSKWISVNDEMPPKDNGLVSVFSVCVLGLTDGFPSIVECWYDYEDKYWGSNVLNLGEKFNITHWMPIPPNP